MKRRTWGYIQNRLLEVSTIRGLLLFGSMIFGYSVDSEKLEDIALIVVGVYAALQFFLPDTLRKQETQE